MMLFVVIGTLEIEAGLREVLIPAHQAADSESVAATSPGHVDVEDAQPDTRLLEFFQSTTSWSPSTRLAMRAHPVFHIAGFHDRLHTLVLSLSSASNLASELEGTLECILRRILDRVPDLPPDLNWALDRDLDRGLDPARDLGRDLDRTLDSARAVARDLVRDLGSELAHIRDLDHLPTVDLNYALNHVQNLDTALDRNFTQASNYARLSIHDLAQYHGQVRALIPGLDRVQSFAGELARTIHALVHFHRVLSDATGVDLRSADLAGIPLQGLRWSARTQWPPEIENQIWRDSIQVADGIFEVRHGGKLLLPS